MHEYVLGTKTLGTQVDIILGLINMYFDSSITIKKMVENVILRQMIGNKNWQQEFFNNKIIFGENTFVGVMSKSTNLAKITLLVSMETWSNDNSDKI